MKILFICDGNVGRSQIAEAYYNNFTNSLNATSAGIDPKTPLKWTRPAQVVLDVMLEENLDLSHKKIKFVTPEMINKAEKIFILCNKKDCPDFILKHTNIYFWKIKDPYKFSIEKTRLIRDKIKKHVLEII